jgi:hypothetical protein
MPRSSNIGTFLQQRKTLPPVPPPAPTPTYAITTANNVVVLNEGASVAFNVATTGVPNNTTLYWTLAGGTVTAADFNPAVSNGTIVIQNNAATFTLAAKADAITEGNETFAVAIRTGNASGPIVATSPTITIYDTSPAVTYSATPSALSVNEGSALTITVSTTGVANGTVLYWSIGAISGATSPATAADFAVNTGSLTINNNAGSFTVTPAADNLTEGVETFCVKISTDSGPFTLVAATAGISINDTSTTPAPSMTASMVMVDSANNKYDILSSSYYAGLQDLRNVFNLGATDTTLRKMSYFDLTIENAAFGPLAGSGTLRAAQIGNAYLYKTVPGPTGSVQFVPTDKNYTKGWFTGASWVAVTQLSYDSVKKKAVYRIWEVQSTEETNGISLSAASLTNPTTLTKLRQSDPVWAHHPTTDVTKFTAAETAAWYTLVLPGNQLKFVWRIKATNQS